VMPSVRRSSARRAACQVPDLDRPKLAKEVAQDRPVVDVGVGCQVKPSVTVLARTSETGAVVLQVALPCTRCPTGGSLERGGELDGYVALRRCQSRAAGPRKIEISARLLVPPGTIEWE
jgi:hypothetical protein